MRGLRTEVGDRGTRMWEGQKVRRCMRDEGRGTMDERERSEVGSQRSEAVEFGISELKLKMPKHLAL